MLRPCIADLPERRSRIKLGNALPRPGLVLKTRVDALENWPRLESVRRRDHLKHAEEILQHIAQHIREACRQDVYRGWDIFEVMARETVRGVKSAEEHQAPPEHVHQVAIDELVYGFDELTHDSMGQRATGSSPNEKDHPLLEACSVRCKQSGEPTCSDLSSRALMNSKIVSIHVLEFFKSSPFQSNLPATLWWLRQREMRLSAELISNLIWLD